MTAYKSDFLNTLNERGFIHQCSDFEALDAKLMEGMQSAYIGFDATASSLHVGSLVQIMMLYWFQKCGHKPITLMGGGTTKVGDPSFKDESRPLLDDDSINDNIRSIQTVFAKFLEYNEGENAALMVNNDDWLSKVNYIEFLRDYGTHFTVNRMLSFDSVKLRLEREQPLTFLEFNYMIMQAYDFVELNQRLDTVLQLGGSDQWGNIINGVELGRKKNQVQLFALTTPLLTTASGAKMGKTVDGAVWLNSDMRTPYEYYQFWRNTEDDDVGRFLRLFTILEIAEIEKLEGLEGQEINEAKKILAFEATKLCHGHDAAILAQNTALEVFEQGNAAGLPAITIDAGRLSDGVSILDLFVETGLAESKSEARRLIKGGGAKLNDNKIETEDRVAEQADFAEEDFIKLSAGKKKHAIVKLG